MGPVVLNAVFGIDVGLNDLNDFGERHNFPISSLFLERVEDGVVLGFADLLGKASLSGRIFTSVEPSFIELDHEIWAIRVLKGLLRSVNLVGLKLIFMKFQWIDDFTEIVGYGDFGTDRCVDQNADIKRKFDKLVEGDFSMSNNTMKSLIFKLKINE